MSLAGDFPAHQPATGCTYAGPGAKHMLYWLDQESAWKNVGYNLGVCNCRVIGGTRVGSCHGECRAWDLGLPTVKGRANPVGHEIIQFLLPLVDDLGIQALIFDRTIWSRRSPRGTRYSGKHPHYDHIHGEHTRASARLLNVPTIRAKTGSGGIILPTPPPEPERPTEPPPVVLPTFEEEPVYLRRDGLAKPHPQAGAVWRRENNTATYIEWDTLDFDTGYGNLFGPKVNVVGVSEPQFAAAMRRCVNTETGELMVVADAPPKPRS